MDFKSLSPIEQVVARMRSYKEAGLDQETLRACFDHVLKTSGVTKEMLYRAFFANSFEVT